MREKDLGSLEGRGKEELLPDRGDPFTSEPLTKPVSAQAEFEHLIPEGAERAGKVQGAERIERMKQAENEFLSTPEIEAAVQISGLEPAEIDHGLSAVGPPLPEDLTTTGIPIPAADIPQPTNDPIEPSPSKPRFSTLVDLAPSAEQTIGALLEADAQPDEFAPDPVDTVPPKPEPDQPAREEGPSAGIARPLLQSYEMIVGVLCILALILLPSLLRTTLWPRMPALSAVMRQDLQIFAGALLWGCLGGVVSGLIGLHTHARLKLPVVRPWIGWYLLNPFLGLLLGAFVFLLLRAVFLAFAVDSTLTHLLAPSTYLLAALIGFFQDQPFKAVEGLARRLDQWRQDDG